MFRKVFVGVVRHGRKVLDGLLHRGEGANGKIKRDVAKTESTIYTRSAPQRLFATLKDASTKGVLSKYVARYAQKNLASELRRQFSNSPIYREYRGLAGKLSAYAFVGVGLTSFNKSEQDFSVICEQIRNIFEAKTTMTREGPLENLEDHGVNDYHIGSMIAKGCNAAVYQARYIGDSDLEEDTSYVESEAESGILSDETDSNADSDIEVIEDDFPPTSFNVEYSEEASLESFVYVEREDAESDVEMIDDDDTSESVDDVLFLMTCERETEHIENMEDAVNSCDDPPKLTAHSDIDYDLAIKMMFNYGIESNATALYRELQKEMIPARTQDVDQLLTHWNTGHRAKEKTRLPPHPNIVDMYGGFVDDVPLLSGSTEYPDALPHRINPDGSGRNKTLFLVMKKYPWTLREYLATHPDLSIYHRTLLLAQLVEAMVHLHTHNVAHRDLKSNNIFVEDLGGCPHLVVSDFGDCLPELTLPYITEETSKGGNMALQAPEIATARAGPGQILDYSKADLWAVGTLAYEIYGEKNPFSGQQFSSVDYQEDQLPPMGDGVPLCIKWLVKQILIRDPRQRPDIGRVSTHIHLLLWSPSEWSFTLASRSERRSRTLPPPSTIDLIRWMLTSTARVLLEYQSQQCVLVEHDLRASFMSHVQFDDLAHCVDDLICQKP